MTELRHLRIAVAAADGGSFSAAAQRLNVDVSVVSRIVRDLEESLGISIFERLPRGVRLTAAGMDYVASARDILAQLDRADRAAQLAAAGTSGHLAVGFVWSFTSGPVVQLIRDFGSAHPGVAVRTVEDGNEQLVSRLASDDLDVVLAATDPPPLERLRSIGALSSLPLWLERLCVAVPDAVEAERVTWSDIAEQRLLCRPKDDWRRFVTHVERAGGPRLRFSVQEVSSDGLLGLVAAGLGWVIVPESVAHMDVPGLRMIPIASDGAVLQVEALWDPRTHNPALTRFLALARRTFSRDSVAAIGVRPSGTTSPSA